MNKVIIGSNKYKDEILAYENALLYYVYGRVTFNTEWFLFLLPSIFYFFHHAIEISIKTLLTLRSIKYPANGSKGHQIYKLLCIAVNSGKFSNNVDDLLKDNDLIDLLKNMDASYLKNKYGYPGYQLNGVKLLDLVDKIIIALFEEINPILKSNNHALANLNVPECIEQVFLHGLYKPITYTAIKTELH
jgi:hypothetical protein